MPSSSAFKRGQSIEVWVTCRVPWTQGAPPVRADAEKTPSCSAVLAYSRLCEQGFKASLWTPNQILRLHSGTFLRQNQQGFPEAASFYFDSTYPAGLHTASQPVGYLRTALKLCQFPRPCLLCINVQSWWLSPQFSETKLVNYQAKLSYSPSLPMAHHPVIKPVYLTSSHISAVANYSCPTFTGTWSHIYLHDSVYTSEKWTWYCLAYLLEASRICWDKVLNALVSKQSAACARRHVCLSHQPVKISFLVPRREFGI